LNLVVPLAAVAAEPDSDARGRSNFVCEVEMVSYTFALVLTVVSDDVGNPVPGGVSDIILGAYSAALKTRLSQYWDAVSGGRVEFDWQPDVSLQVTQTMKEWAALSPRDKIAEARAQARDQNLIPDSTEVILIANDADTPRAVTPSGSSPYVHVSQLTAAAVAHELGHFFEWRGSHTAGHADVARDFFRDEYADRTCIMGGESDKFSFKDATIPGLSTLTFATRSGPLMNPALVDQCGWLDPASPHVAVINPAMLGQVTLQSWRGAPTTDAAGGAPVVAILDGRAPDEGRLYMCVREAVGWDRGFASPYLVSLRHETLKLLCVYLSTPSGDSLLLASIPASAGSSSTLGRVPLRVDVLQSTPEGVTIRLDDSPWRGSYALEGVECAPAAQVATAAWGIAADAFVIDRNGKVRNNHFNGHGWEHKPWPLIDGVTCDPLGGIAAVARHAGLVEVFVTDLSGAVHRMQRRDWTWSPAWEPLPGGGFGPQSSLAAARIDDDHLLLCGVRPDGQISRVEVGDAGTLANWVSAPPMMMSHVAATQFDAARGRIYAVAANNVDRSVWATPNIGSPDPGSWGPVGTVRAARGLPLAATTMLGASDVVIVGTDPMLLLSWNGIDWVTDAFGPTQRDPAGGLAIMSRIDDSVDVLYIDSSGGVQVSPWSRRTDFAPAWNQYDSEATVVLEAATGHFVRAKNGGGEGMGADGEGIGEWERFRMLDCQTVIINAGETRRLVVFQTHNGQYVGAVGGGGSHLIAEAGQVGPWETFYLNPLPGFLPGVGPVTIGCIDESHFWSAVGGGGAALAADKTDPKDWERFELLVLA